MYSMQQKRENQPREVKSLNEKERISFLVSSTKSGEKIFDILVIDKNKPNDLKVEKK